MEKIIDLWKHPEREVFNKFIREKNDKNDLNDELVQRISSEVKDMPYFLGVILYGPDSDLSLFLLEKFKEISPIIQYLDQTSKEVVSKIKKDFPLSYRNYLNRKFEKVYKKKMYLEPTPTEGLKEISFWKEKNPDGVIFKENTIQYLGQEYYICDILHTSKFEFENGIFHFANCFVFDRPILNGQNIIYFNLFYEETDVEHISYKKFNFHSVGEGPSLDLFKNTRMYAQPGIYDYLHSLSFKINSPFPHSSQDQVATPENPIQGNIPENISVEFMDGGGQAINGIWTGSFEIKEHEEDFPEIKIHYMKFRQQEDPEDIDIKIDLFVKGIRKGKFSFTTYGTQTFSHEVTFYNSPCPESLNRSTNLFNIIEQKNSYPLVFYF